MYQRPIRRPRRRPRRPRVFKKERGASGFGRLLLFLLICVPLGAGIWVILGDFNEEHGAAIGEELSKVEAAITEAFAPAEPSEVEAWLVRLTNIERVAAGLRPLRRDGDIAEIARAHSADMLANGKLAHELGGKDANERAEAAGYDCRRLVSESNGTRTYTRGLSENISQRSGDWSPDPEPIARKIVTGWMNSPGHRKNILDPMNERIGVGVAYNEGTWYSTQNFSPCK